MRLAAFAASLALLVAAAVTVPLPLVEIAPGGTTSIPELVEIRGTETTPVNGDLSLLTVSLDQPSLAEAARAFVSPVRDLQPPGAVIPSGVERQEYFRSQRRQFAREFDIAAAVGVRQAGYEVELRTAVYVAGVLPGGPADGVLEVGDLIVALGGRPVSSAEELVSRLSGVEAGDELEVTVERGDDTLGLTVVAGQAAGMDQPGFGILVETIANAVDLPFTVDLTETRIGGPSAGMMIALTVYDLLSDDDVAAGRSIAGTGSISPEGQVGSIGGIEEKVVAAERAGADVLLVPAMQVTAARTAVEGDIELHGVASLDEAVDVLTGP